MSAPNANSLQRNQDDAVLLPRVVLLIHVILRKHVPPLLWCVSTYRTKGRRTYSNVAEMVISMDTCT